MRVTVNDNKIKLAGKEIGYYCTSEFPPKHKYAYFDYNGIAYEYQAQTVSEIRDYVKLAIIEG